jgi:hypothetical protein
MISPNIDMPNGMVYEPGFGLDAIMGYNIIDRDTRIIRNLANDNNICFERIIISQMSKQINQSTPYRINEKKPGAILKLKVLGYGFIATKLGFSNKLAPTLSVEAQLISYSNNRVLWQDAVTACERTDTLSSYSMDEIAGDARRLNQMWWSVSNVVSRKLVQKLNTR